MHGITPGTGEAEEPSNWIGRSSCRALQKACAVKATHDAGQRLETFERRSDRRILMDTVSFAKGDPCHGANSTDRHTGKKRPLLGPLSRY